MQQYNAAPLPFQGQKRNFVRIYRDLLATLPDDAIFVDLFGGSGLLSHATRVAKPNATVVYNDYDNYRQRIAAIPTTNALLARIRPLVANVARHARIPDETRLTILDILQQADKQGYVDYITLSSSLLFSSKYATSLDGFVREQLYNNVRRSDYSAEGYLDGIEIASVDYRELFERYKDNPRAIFLLDPPYLSTDTTTYNMSWSLSDYLDVLTLLNGHRFVYFTSSKSQIFELCDWLGRNPSLGNPFVDAVRHEHVVALNYTAGYTDIMLAKVY